MGDVFFPKIEGKRTVKVMCLVSFFVNVARQRGSTNWRFEMLWLSWAGWPCHDSAFIFFIWGLWCLMAKAKSHGSQCELSTKQQTDFFGLCYMQHSFDDQTDIIYWQEIEKCINKEKWTRISRETEGNTKHLQRGWRCWGWIFGTFPKTNIDIAPANRPSERETCLPIIHFQRQFVSFRKCTPGAQRGVLGRCENLHIKKHLEVATACCCAGDDMVKKKKGSSDRVTPSWSQMCSTFIISNQLSTTNYDTTCRWSCKIIICITSHLFPSWLPPMGIHHPPWRMPTRMVSTPPDPAFQREWRPGTKFGRNHFTIGVITILGYHQGYRHFPYESWI